MYQKNNYKLGFNEYSMPRYDIEKLKAQIKSLEEENKELKAKIENLLKELRCQA